MFIVVAVGYLWTDNHNRKQKQQFIQTIYQCEIKIKSQPKDDGSICLAENYCKGADILFGDEKYGQDLQKSLYWYEQLALDGYPDAQFEMAKIHEQGIGVSQDLKNANAWYYQAYLSGNLEAGFVLANHLAQGRGIEKNHQQALLL